MSNLSPDSSIVVPDDAILNRDSESGVLLMQTAIFTVDPRCLVVAFSRAVSRQPSAVSRSRSAISRKPRLLTSAVSRKPNAELLEGCKSYHIAPRLADIELRRSVKRLMSWLHDRRRGERLFG